MTNVDLNRPGIAIFSDSFLTLSMTFIYRQTCGIKDRYNPIILTSKVDNQHAFPFEPIYCQSIPGGLQGRILSKMYRLLTKSFIFNTKKQLAIWRKACEKHTVELVHAHFGYGGIQMAPIAKSLGIPLVVTFHGKDASMLLRNAIYNKAIKEMLGYAKVICVSAKMRDRLVSFYKINPDNVYVHYIGVPLEDFRVIERKALSRKKKDGECIKFLQVSNFVEKKGHEYTLKAYKNFLKTYPNSQLILAGDGPLRSQNEKLCEQLGLNNNVKFVGKVIKEQVMDLMAKADVFLHHSVTSRDGDQEGIPTVIMEAMATGLPVISTFHSGIPELVMDGETGYLVEERNTYSYFEKMVAILNEDGSFGLRGREVIENKFNMQKQNLSLSNIYKKVLNTTGKYEKMI